LIFKDLHKLQLKELRKFKDEASWKFKTTDEITLKKTKTPAPLIGQQRAVEAMDFGLAVNGRGYNIFITGQPDNGRTSYALEKLEVLAKNLPAPDDWLYLYNFEKPEEPMSISVKAGQGKKKNCSHQGINIPLVAVSVLFDLTVSILRETVLI